MSIAFSLHKQSYGLHWYVSKPIDPAVISALKQPQPNYPALSNPSPLATMERVRQAYQNLAERMDLAGTNEDQRLVSESLDVGEVFFNYDRFDDRADIQEIDIQVTLEQLQCSADLGHHRLSEMLSDVFAHGESPYNARHFRQLFALRVNGQLVGGTSPTTFFFTSATSYKVKPISFQNRLLFGVTPLALYQRDIEYQKYWYSLQMLMPGFRQRFRAVDDYLIRCRDLLRQYQPEVYTQYLESYSGQSHISHERFYSDFAALTLSSGEVVNVLGFALRQSKPDPAQVEKVSDFIIKSPKYERQHPGIPRPMVLQNNFHLPYTYLPQTRWNPAVSVPFVSEASWQKNNRLLPGQPDIYPWLTVSDFLEPYLIRLPYPINRHCYFDGNRQGSDTDKGFLLPLKKEFFDFFDVQDLLTNRVRLAITPQGRNILVSLSIPVTAPSQPGNQCITLERLYESWTPDRLPNEAINVGLMIEHSFTLNIFPFLRSGRVALPADYRVQFIESGMDVENHYQLDYYQNDKNAKLKEDSRHIRTVRQWNTDGSSFVDVIRSEFDYCQVTVNFENVENQAILIPKWDYYQGGSKKFSFSVDFGTTSTHIEYSVEGGTPCPFNIAELTPQVATLVAPAQYNPALFELFLLYDLEFVPPTIGPGRPDNFPTRTAIAEPKNLSFNQQTQALADFNIPFYVERQPAGSNRITTNLKWDYSGAQGARRAEAFLEELLMLIRYKVLAEGGDLSQTTIHWLYPSSMTPGRVSLLRADWKRLFQRYIGNNTSRLREMMESIAPFYYYKQNLILSASVRPVVSIDIGGGTTDVVVFQANEPVLLTSFRFAGNAIYGDGFSEHGAASHNGFVRKYADKIQTLLASQSLGNLSDYNRRIIETNRSEDIMNFWFSLERSNDVRNKQLLSFHRMLSLDEDMKVIFVFFLCALLYHIAKLLKHKGIDMPGAITFSGSGSKVIPIISPDNSKLGQLAQLIFEQVYHKPLPSGKLHFTYENRHPKELTCKGALLQSAYSRPVDFEAINYVYPATHNDAYATLMYADVQKTDVVDSLLKETNAFIDFFFALNQQFSFVRNLNVSARALAIAQQELRINHVDSLKEGIHRKREDLMDEHNELLYVLGLPVEETLFFYPLIGVMNKLANSLA